MTLLNSTAQLTCDSQWRILAQNEEARHLFANGRFLAVGTLVTDCAGLTPRKLDACQLGPTLVTLRDQNGSELPVIIFVTANAGHKVIHMLSARVLARKQRNLAKQESVWRRAIEAADQGVWIYNLADDTHFHSDGWKRMRGFPLGVPIDDSEESWIARLHPDDAENTIELVRRNSTGEVPNFACEYRERRLDGGWLWVLSRGKVIEWTTEGKPALIVGTDVDITAMKNAEARHIAETEEIYQRHIQEMSRATNETQRARALAERQARVDTLTGLENRRAFQEHIVAQETRSDEAGILLIDLNKFKSVNDTYGHAVGDHVLKIAGRRLAAVVGSKGHVARLGGDEFGIILQGKGVAGEKSITSLCSKIISKISQPIVQGSRVIEIGCGIGIAIMPSHGSKFEIVMRNADMALYRAKSSASNAFTLYAPSMHNEIAERNAFEARVTQAVADDVFEPYFQPVINLETGAIAKFEVLARWLHRESGLVPPDSFLPAIERLGLTSRFTANMLRKACRVARHFPNHISISFNLSAREVCDLATPTQIMDMLLRTTLSPLRLELELTEQALLKDFDVASHVIFSLRSAGVRVYIDDFGAGFAGIGYLRNLKTDGFKVDRSYIRDSLKTKRDCDFLTALQALAHSLDLTTIAEGIENEHMLRNVKAAGFTYGQGFHFARPMPAEEAIALANGQSPMQLDLPKRGAA